MVNLVAEAVAGGHFGGEGVDEGFFVAEVAVDGGDADVGFGGDLFYGGFDEANAAEDGAGGGEDFLAVVMLVDIEVVLLGEAVEDFLFTAEAAVDGGAGDVEFGF